MKSALLPTIAAVVLLGATFSIARTQPSRTTSPPPVAPPRSPFVERVAAIGLVEPSSENIAVSAYIPGVVRKVRVTAGQEIEAGAPLIELDTRHLDALRAERQATLVSRQAAVQTARARAQKARVALADAQRHLKFVQAVTDARSVSSEEVARRQGQADLAEAEKTAAEAEISAAESAVAAAEAALKSVDVDLVRSVVVAPISGRVLQVRIRPGEYVPAGPLTEPWLVLGHVSPMHVRADIDEQEIWRVQPGAAAVAQVRGNADLRVSASFVRFEPLVIPKRSLTGASNERVDTRVLQVIYRIETPTFPLFVGQQMDLFIEFKPAGMAAKESETSKRSAGQ